MKIHILTLLYLSPTSINKPPAATSMHLWSLRWKSGANYNSNTVFCFFCECATLSQLLLLNSLITRALPSGNWCRYVTCRFADRLDLSWSQFIQIYICISYNFDREILIFFLLLLFFQISLHGPVSSGVLFIFMTIVFLSSWKQDAGLPNGLWTYNNSRSWTPAEHCSVWQAAHPTRVLS